MGFNGVPGNMQALVRQAQQMQEKLKKKQEEAKAFTAEISAGGGAITVVVNGESKIVSIKFNNPEILNDAEMLQDLIMVAVNEALTKVQEQVQTEIGKVTGGINIPGLF